MGKSYYVPRSAKGESRILYIFSVKSFITTLICGGIGALIVFLIKSVIPMSIFTIILLIVPFAVENPKSTLPIMYWTGIPCFNFSISEVKVSGCPYFFRYSISFLLYHLILLISKKEEPVVHSPLNFLAWSSVIKASITFPKSPSITRSKVLMVKPIR